MAAVSVCCQPFLATLPWYLWTDAIAGAVRIELEAQIINFVREKNFDEMNEPPNHRN
jgi:hypothetical protein